MDIDDYRSSCLDWTPNRESIETDVAEKQVKFCFRSVGWSIFLFPTTPKIIILLRSLSIQKFWEERLRNSLVESNKDFEQRNKKNLHSFALNFFFKNNLRKCRQISNSELYLLDLPVQERVLKQIFSKRTIVSVIFPLVICFVQQVRIHHHYLPFRNFVKITQDECIATFFCSSKALLCSFCVTLMKNLLFQFT